MVLIVNIESESDNMLSKKEVKIRYLICLALFFLSGSKIITGWPAAICGVVGTMELATALLWYSPLHDTIIPFNPKKKLNNIIHLHKPGIPMLEGHKFK